MEGYDKHEHALSVLKHPLNRKFLEQIIGVLNPGGIYIWKGINEPFTREELVRALEEVQKEDADGQTR